MHTLLLCVKVVFDTHRSYTSFQNGQAFNYAAEFRIHIMPLPLLVSHVVARQTCWFG